MKTKWNGTSGTPILDHGNNKDGNFDDEEHCKTLGYQ